ncbi:uncharacterized protein LOC132739303 [Ruditapes philippinarum]|uniref:uncharacterized protein LOC132739303 n=1 Tax=Ruditapes philippinarum TaxID=129788 RepID=UPI00295ACDDD|nr:uncharacterized protein LOC132739303 [Ruditapes philippinarum]
MKKTTHSVERLQDMLKHASRKRKRSSSPDSEALPPAKRPRLRVITPSPLPRSFLRKVKAWHDRKRKIELGIALYLEAQRQKIVDAISLPAAPSMSLSEEALSGIRAAEDLIEEITREIEASAPKRRGMIKRLASNDGADDSLEVKVIPVKRRGGWRKNGQRRF